MGFIERILLLIYFPQFKSPNNSRFESFFISILKKEDSYKKNKNKSKIIFPEKIIRNEDKRTSLIIKGIPHDMSKKDVRDLIEKHGNLNFLYIIKDSNNEEKNSSIAYANVINYKTIIPIYMNLRNFEIKRNEKTYKIKMSYSNVQGKEELKKYIRHNKFL
jgi:RNA recognition motif-containing protein